MIKLSEFVDQHGNAAAAKLLDQPQTTINELSKGDRKKCIPFVKKEGGVWNLYLRKLRREDQKEKE